jgi:hypothetical protein
MVVASALIPVVRMLTGQYDPGRIHVEAVSGVDIVKCY